jgi:hypothetical protein
MADRVGRVSGWSIAAFVVALLVLGVAAGALVWARSDRDDARREQAQVRRVLAASRDAGAADRLAATRAELARIRPQLDAAVATSAHVADLTQQDATLVESVLDAAGRGDVAAYNEAAAKRNDLAPQVDATVEQLRNDVNAVLVALGAVTQRTAP